MTTAWTGRWSHWPEEQFFSEATSYRKPIHDRLLKVWFAPEAYADQKGRTRCLAKLYRKGLRVVKVRFVSVTGDTGQ